MACTILTSEAVSVRGNGIMYTVASIVTHARRVQHRTIVPLLSDSGDRPVDRRYLFRGAAMAPRTRCAPFCRFTPLRYAARKEMSEPSSMLAASLIGHSSRASIVARDILPFTPSAAPFTLDPLADAVIDVAQPK